MPEQSISTLRKARLPGLDADATPVIGVGLGLTGIMLGVRPRLAPVSLALTAAGARLCKSRFGSYVDLLLPRDAVEQLPDIGARLRAGTTRIGRVVPL